MIGTMRPLTRPVVALGHFLVGDSAASRAAALYSTVTAGASFMPGLMPRGLREQVALTGVASTLQHTLVMNAQARHRLAARLICSWTGHDSARSVRGMEAAVAVGTTMAGAAGYLALRERGGESFRRRAARTVAIRSLRIGMATLTVTAAEFVDERYGRRHPAVRVVTPLAGFLVGTGIASALIRRFHRPDAVVEARAALSRDPLTGERLRPERKQEEIGATSVPVSIALGFGVSVVLNVAGDAELAVSRLVARLIDRFIPGSGPYATLVGRSLVLGGVVTAVGVGWEYLYRQAEAGGSAIDKAYTSAPTSHYVSGGPSSRGGLADPRPGGGPVRGHVAPGGPDRRGHRDPGGRREAADPLLLRPRDRPDGARAGHGGDGGDGAARGVRAVGDLRLLAHRDRLHQLRGHRDARVPHPRRLRDGRPAVLAAAVVPLAGPGSPRAGAEPGSAQRAHVADPGPARTTGARRLVGFGESLGAQTLQSCFLHEGVAGFERAGIDATLFLGTPAGSEWKREWRIHPAEEDPKGEVVQVVELSAVGRRSRPGARTGLGSSCWRTRRTRSPSSRRGSP